jgi:transposase
MNWLTELFSRRRLYSDLSAEIQEHLDEKVEELIAEGRTTPEFRMEFDKVWWGFLSLSDSLLCCQTGGTQ